MRKLIAAGLAGLALTAAVPALAASGDEIALPDGARMKMDCRGLQKEFDQAEPYARMNSNLPRAEHLRGESGRLCEIGEFSRGISNVRTALHILDIDPLTTTGPIEDGAG